MFTIMNRFSTLVLVSAFWNQTAFAETSFQSIKAELNNAQLATLTQIQGMHVGKCYLDPRAKLGTSAMNSIVVALELKKSEGWKGKLVFYLIPERNGDVGHNLTWAELAVKYLEWARDRTDIPWIAVDAPLDLSERNTRTRYFRNPAGKVFVVYSTPNGGHFVATDSVTKKHLDYGEYKPGEDILRCSYEFKAL